MQLYNIRPLDSSHNTEMLKVLRSAPINAENLTVCFDRQPDFFGLPEAKYDPYYYYGFFRQDHLKGFCGIGYYNAMVNGSYETIFHMRDYYVSPEARGKGFGLKVAEKFYKETYNHSVLGYLIIMSGNRDSLTYVGHRNTLFPYLPFSRIINQLDVRNIMLIWPVLNSRDYSIRRADNQDIPEIVALLNNEHTKRLFGNRYEAGTFNDYLDKCPGLTISNFFIALDRTKRPCGVCTAWDCSSFKQTRVLRYGKRFRTAKFLYKGLSAIFQSPPLPAPGECFKDIVISDYATRDRDPAIMNALLRYVYNDCRKRGFQNMIWGSSSDDPLLKASESFFYQRIISNIVLISTKQELAECGAVRNCLPYIDLPCL